MLSGDLVRITGTCERNVSGLASIFASTTGGAKQVTRHRLEYSGTLRGRAIIGFVKRIDEGGVSAATSLLASVDGSVKTLMFLADDETEIKVMENPYSAIPALYSLKKID